IIKQIKEFLLDDKIVVPLGAINQEAVFSTREMLMTEEKLQAAIDEGKNKRSHVIRKSVAERILDRELPLASTLSEDEMIRNKEQRSAVIRITTQPGDAVIEGMAGTGKTRILKAARA